MTGDENLDEKVLEAMTEVFLHGTLTQARPKSGTRRSSERQKGS
jgi:hypothetical protein